MQCTIKNATQFDIVPLAHYFKSGRFLKSPEDIKSFGQMVFSSSNPDYKVEGVLAGSAFRLSFSSERYLDFALVSKHCYKDFK